MAVSSGIFALALTASACSNGATPSAQGNGSTTTEVHSSTTTSRPGGGSTSTSTPSSTSTTAGPDSAPAGPSPTLGVASVWGASAIGFGQVKPAEISLGGDPTGILTGITWQSWGGATATGTGTSTYVPPGASTAQGSAQTATVEAFELGTCGGAPAYEEVKWYFPGEGETLITGANRTIHTCAGP